MHPRPTVIIWQLHGIATAANLNGVQGGARLSPRDGVSALLLLLLLLLLLFLPLLLLLLLLLFEKPGQNLPR
jgi:hypothetical protein